MLLCREREIFIAAAVLDCFIIILSQFALCSILVKKNILSAKKLLK